MERGKARRVGEGEGREREKGGIFPFFSAAFLNYFSLTTWYSSKPAEEHKHTLDPEACILDCRFGIHYDQRKRERVRRVR